MDSVGHALAGMGIFNDLPAADAVTGGSENFRAHSHPSGYAAATAWPPDSRVSIGAAGVVAHNLNGPVTVTPQIRMRDVLSGSLVDRAAVRDNRAYVEAGEWSQAWKEAIRALPENRVIIVVAPRGYGSTTFSLRLLACHASAHAELIRLEADWKTPKIEMLPVQQNRAYQLDLQDPDHDRFDGAFLNGLGQHSQELRALGSYLVLAVVDGLWPGHYGQVPPAVTVLRLDKPPDARQFVEHHLTAQGLESLVPYLWQPAAARHIQGRDAVQAMRAVEIIVRQWEEYRSQQVGQRVASDSPAPEVAPSASGLEVPALDPGLQQSIEQALGNWQDNLDRLFDEPRQRRDLKDDGPLSIEDRCLLMSLALRQTGTAVEIESAALALEQALAKSGGDANRGVASAWDVFSRRGLRPRLRSFQAAIDGRDRVTFSRPGYAEAVLTYVWDNYSGLRDDLIAWMVRCAAGDSQHEDPAADTLIALILRLQDAERLTSLRDRAIAEGRRDVIIRVMAAAATDEHMGRRARSFMYDWASQRSEIQRVVIAVCRKLIGVKEDMALVRLRRVAHHASDDGVRAQVLAVFREAAADQKFTDHFADAVASWQRSDPASRAVKLGLLALLGAESDNFPWIPSRPTAIDVTAGLRELLADLSSFPETVPVLVDWMRACRQAPGLYARARSLVAGALRDQHAFNAGITVMKQLAEVRTPDGGSVGEDLYAEIVQPELRSLSPLIRLET